MVHLIWETREKRLVLGLVVLGLLMILIELLNRVLEAREFLVDRVATAPILAAKAIETPAWGESSPLYTWRLAALHGENPMPTHSDETASPAVASDWPRLEMSESFWLRYLADRKPGLCDARFGHVGAIPVTGDFDGNGTPEIGVFLNGHWFVDLNNNGLWDENDLYARFGSTSDLPVTGDWDGDGKTDIAVFGPAEPGDSAAMVDEQGLPDALNSGTKLTLHPRDSHPVDHRYFVRWGSHSGEIAMQVQHVMQLGKPGDLPVAGDWDGDGIDTIGIFRHGRWMLDVNGNGRFDAADLAFAYGEHDDLPITGDWNGDSITDVGVYRHGYWILDTNSDHRLDHGDVQRAFGYETDKPVVIDEHGVGGIHFELYRAIISRNRPI